MKSKGGKREWLCPMCESPKIQKHIKYGQNSGLCETCREWWPWTWRLKVKVNE